MFAQDLVTTAGSRRASIWRGALAVCVALFLGGCANVSFYWQAARGQLDLMSRRVPVEDVLADDSVSDTLRDALRSAYEARQFASSDLGLPDNNSYQTYADIERPYVVWNVFAAPEFDVQPRTWCFPFAGCVAYRGYFAEENAARQMEKLREQGYDTYYGGVAAYSTLGRFADPIMNTMLKGDSLRTVALIFHELAHQVAYRPSDSAFSESFASFVEREGVRRYLAQRDASADFARYSRSLEYQQAFSELVVAARERLAGLYARELDENTMREEKAAMMTRLREDYATLKSGWDGYSGYDNWFARDLNNAHLATVSTYHRYVPAFREMLAESGGDLPAFYQRVRELAALEDEAVTERLEALLARAAAAPKY